MKYAKPNWGAIKNYNSSVCSTPWLGQSLSSFDMVIQYVSLGGWCLFKLHFKVVTIELNHDVHMDLLYKYFSTFIKRWSM